MPTFKSFVQGGFECATQKNKHGRRLDIVHSSRHDQFLMQDYRRVAERGIRTVREGLRWHLIEPTPGVFDFSSVERMLELAQTCGMEIILDLMHFGWPEWVDVFSPEFPNAFERFAAAIAPMLRRMNRAYVIAVNEMSFLAWAGGDEALLNPHTRGRGGELKRQLVRAAIRASRVLRERVPNLVLLTAEPMIHIAPRPGQPGDELSAERHRLAMYEATDMLTGRTCRELGGSPDLVDVMGINFYDRNQWQHNGPTLGRTDAGYRPFHAMLLEVWQRYGKPVLVSETGTEDAARPDWFEYIASEVRAAMRSGVPVKGICLYPIVNHPGWDDDRHCCNGLWDYADDAGHREIYTPLARVIARERVMFGEIEKVA